MNHMEIISNVVSAEEITDWLDISAGGMIIARTGTLGGFGFEMMYQNQEYFMPSTDLQFSGQSNKAATYGLGVFHKNKKGDRTSIGLMLSGDSEIEYQTNGRGVLQIMGVDMDKEGSIPTTINLYMKKKWKDGDSLYGGVFVDGASYLVDEDAINDDARFFDGGRGFGRAGATISYSKNLGEGSNIVFTGGANNNFKDPAFCITFTKTFGGSPSGSRLNSTIKDSMRAINRMPSSVRNHDFSPTIKGAVSMLNREINETGHKIDSIKAVERITASLDKTLKAMENGSLTESNLRDHYNIQRDDLKKLKEYELKTLYDDRLSRSVENLTFIIQRELSRKGQVRKLKERERELRRSMDALTNAFGEESSAEIMKEYSKKVEELDNLNKSRS